MTADTDTRTQDQIDAAADNEYGRHLAHRTGPDACRECRPARACDESMRLYTAMKQAEGRRQTPYIVTGNPIEYSTGYVSQSRTGHWTASSAAASANVMFRPEGATVTTAPEGALERLSRDQEAERAERDAKHAAWIAAGGPRPTRGYRR